jgi:hypothetical protein
MLRPNAEQRRSSANVKGHDDAPSRPVRIPSWRRGAVIQAAHVLLTAKSSRTAWCRCPPSWSRNCALSGAFTGIRCCAFPMPGAATTTANLWPPGCARPGMQNVECRDVTRMTCYCDASGQRVFHCAGPLVNVPAEGRPASGCRLERGHSPGVPSRRSFDFLMLSVVTSQQTSK